MHEGDDEIQNLEAAPEAPIGDLPAAEESLPEELLAGEPPGGLPLDELLSAAVLPEGTEFALPEGLPEAPLEATPPFQLRVLSLPDKARVALQKAFEAEGVPWNEKAALPAASHLNEYQTVALMQAARSLGASVSATVQRMDFSPSEEDLALGELAALPDSPAPAAETAPSITLARGEKDVMLCTPTEIPGIEVKETLGLAMAHRSIARRLFREEEMREKLEKELQALPNRASHAIPSSHLQLILRDLCLDLRKAALAQGGNAVLGVKLEAFPESNPADSQLEQLRLVAFGTAAVVEKL